ncbi:MAG: diguanylate cyclase [Thermodesulfobacteriota bacterium]
MFNHLQLLDHLSIGIAVIDREMKIVFWNQWMAEHSLINQDEINGRSIEDFFPSLNKGKFTKRAKEVFENNQPIFFNNKINPHMFPFYSGRSYIEKQLEPMEQTVILSPLHDEEGNTEQLLVSVFDISDFISHQKALLKSTEEMELLSHTDDLTQIPNRRNILETLNSEMQTHKRKRRPMSIAMLDVDHFKRINDNYGHQCGDLVLHELAQFIVRQLRDYDIIGRYGGEEFLLILPETTGAQAFSICDRIRKAVQDDVFRYNGREIQVTASIGIAARKSEENIIMNNLIKEADRCLYIAKGTGRNRTEIQDVSS